VAADVARLDSVGPVFEFVGWSTPQGVMWAWARQDLDLCTAPTARAELADVLAAPDGPEWMLVHLGVECFVDLHGLRLLVEVAAQVRVRGGDLVVVAPPRCLRMMVGLMDLGPSLLLSPTARHAAWWVRTRTRSQRDPDTADRPRHGAP
jgi:anti-anti-sigma regulatory factor